MFKYRVFDKVTKQMLSDFHLFGEVTLLGAIHDWQAECLGQRGDSLGRLNDLITMQFTGLKDKKGQCIYEGDILDYGPVTGKHEVKWDSEWLMWDFVRYEDQSLYGTDSIEVIGNIHQNPELL